MNLFNLNEGEKGYIVKVRGRGAFRKRIIEMGFIAGKEITVIKKAPLKDPCEYKIMNYNVSLRNSEAQLIDIVKENPQNQNNYFGNFSDLNYLQKKISHNEKTINVVLVGNPNSGKTTLYNNASGAKEKVGNYSGVTVDAKKTCFKFNDYTFHLIDLPGTYSISAYSPEEIYVRNYIINNVPDVVLNVVDASNLERNLYLTTQLIDMDIKMVIALNMYDEFIEKGDILNYHLLSKMIGVPLVPTVSNKNEGINKLLSKIIEIYEDKDKDARHVHINYGDYIENSITLIQSKIKIAENYALTDIVSSRFLSIKLLEADNEISQYINKAVNSDEINKITVAEIAKLEKIYNENSETIITDSKYGFIAGALKETLKPGLRERRKTTEIIDTFLTHKLFGFPIFIFFMWLMFTLTYVLGDYPKHFIEDIIRFVSEIISKHMPAGILKDLIIDGIISGVGGVIVYLPNILILFFFISFMEDTGYMARAVFIMDKLMHKIGLHGKSFIPLIMGFGCNVPAIMATRSIENKNDRLITILINPLMSCSARLPVYVLLISAFFPNSQGTYLFLIYLIGIFLAIIASLILKKTIFKEDSVPFVMELPPYRIPTAKSTIMQMWNKGIQYLKKIGGVILIASIIIWTLGYFPRNNTITTDLNKIDLKKIDQSLNILHDTLNINYKNTISNYDNKVSQQEQSYIGKIGKFIEPVFVPLGFDWKITVSLICGIPAKEIIVGTMGVLYQADDEHIDNSLVSKLKYTTYKNGSKKGQKVFNPIVALSLMIFVLIYFPCIGTIVVISRESGSWKWGIFTIAYTTSLAWLISFLVYNIGNLFY